MQKCPQQRAFPHRRTGIRTLKSDNVHCHPNKEHITKTQRKASEYFSQLTTPPIQEHSFNDKVWCWFQYLFPMLQWLPYTNKKKMASSSLDLFLFKFFSTNHITLSWEALGTLGVGPAGFLIDFLSKATLVGFMAELQIIVSLQQLKALLGLLISPTKCRLSLSCASVSFKPPERDSQLAELEKPKTLLISAAAHSHVALAQNRPHTEFLISSTRKEFSWRTFASLENYQVDGNKDDRNVVRHICWFLLLLLGHYNAFSRSLVMYNCSAGHSGFLITLPLHPMLSWRPSLYCCCWIDRLTKLL
ncbi:hypothetical protein Cgig2_020780 [Carnegiea gigantea]|uniref:Uncharacterized protein n=1 Tax=Carnegiea gigantea TaxID=171969 RepID=A0A9Q1Q7R6_9CARY|nr:hypothetical protein Cgig2_020780 [Carnegiea gigantea]